MSKRFSRPALGAARICGLAAALCVFAAPELTVSAAEARPEAERAPKADANAAGAPLATRSLGGPSTEKRACTADVFRFCSAEVPQVDQIIACLKKERLNLSPACRAAFDKG